MSCGGSKKNNANAAVIADIVEELSGQRSRDYIATRFHFLSAVAHDRMTGQFQHDNGRRPNRSEAKAITQAAHAEARHALRHNIMTEIDDQQREGAAFIRRLRSGASSPARAEWVQAMGDQAAETGRLGGPPPHLSAWSPRPEANRSPEDLAEDHRIETEALRQGWLRGRREWAAELGRAGAPQPNMRAWVAPQSGDTSEAREEYDVLYTREKAALRDGWIEGSQRRS
jgi:hypothetical protein